MTDLEELTYVQAAALAGVSREHIYRACISDVLPFTWIHEGRSGIRIRKADLERWMREREVRRIGPGGRVP